MKYNNLNIFVYLLIMPIKHLVIAGGGPIGIQFLGALEYLNEQDFWKLEDIESIYATSVGTMMAAMMVFSFILGYSVGKERSRRVTKEEKEP